MEQNLYSALVCFLNDSSEFRKKYKPDAGSLMTLHDRARSIRLQDGRVFYGTKGVKVPTIDETTVVLKEAHINEAGSHIQPLKTLVSALGSLSMDIPAFLGGVSGVVQELEKSSLFSFQFKAFFDDNFTYLSHTSTLNEVTLLRFLRSCPDCYMDKFSQQRIQIRGVAESRKGAFCTEIGVQFNRNPCFCPVDSVSLGVAGEPKSKSQRSDKCVFSSVEKSLEKSIGPELIVCWNLNFQHIVRLSWVTPQRNLRWCSIHERIRSQLRKTGLVNVSFLDCIQFRL